MELLDFITIASILADNAMEAQWRLVIQWLPWSRKLGRFGLL